MSEITERQEFIDRFYIAHGPCCAGCDWWRSLNTRAGDCHRIAPVAGSERAAMLGMHGVSASIDAGHAMTLRDHYCGEFRDEFDWTSLPLVYRRRIGHPSARGDTRG